MKNRVELPSFIFAVVVPAPAAIGRGGDPSSKGCGPKFPPFRPRVKALRRVDAGMKEK
jgi:hypothetical protein